MPWPGLSASTPRGSRRSARCSPRTTRPDGLSSNWWSWRSIRWRNATGLAGALLDAHHAHLDAEGIPAYVEAASLALTSFFQRHGYLRLELPIVLPDGRQIYPMWREPHEP